MERNPVHVWTKNQYHISLNPVEFSYQSGNAAIIITSSEKGQYEYIVQEDTPEKGNLLAVFEPNGKATCHQNNGQIK